MSNDDGCFTQEQHEWAYTVTARDDYGMRRETGFDSLLQACDYAHEMDASPLEFASRDVVLFIRAQGKRFIPVGEGFHAFEPLARKAAGG